MRDEALELLERGRPAAPAEERAVEQTIPSGPPPPVARPDPPRERELRPWLLAGLLLVVGGLCVAFLLAARTDDAGVRVASAGSAAKTRTARAPSPRPARALSPRPVASTEVTVPGVVGLPAPAALKALRRLGLTASTHGVVSTRPRNEVVSQAPGASKKLAKGAAVVLDVSTGPKTVRVPDVVGQSVSDALATLTAQGLRANPVRVPNDESVGRVVAQHPRAGVRARTGSVARLNVSEGLPAERSDPTSTVPVPSPPEKSTPAATDTAPAPRTPVPATVPDVRGRNVGEARALLRRSGLVLEIRRVPNALPRDSVVAQSRPQGTALRRGDHLLVTVSLGREPTVTQEVTIPDVVGEYEATATADLQDAGFSIQVVDREATDPAEDGIVVDQTPAAGQTATRRSAVTLVIGRYSGTETQGGG